MEKRKFLIIFSLFFIILFVLPVNVSYATDGGSRYVSPIIPVYTVIDYNQIATEGPLMSHSDPDYVPPGFYRVKGRAVEIFGIRIYENKYRVDNSPPEGN